MKSLTPPVGVFRRCGFHAASMSQIASEAQLSVGQIYRYFANKDAIIEEMVRRIIDFRIAQMDIDARTDHFGSPCLA